MTNNRWIDKKLPENLEEVFINYGKVRYVEEGEIILDKEDQPSDFYYVDRGLLAVSLCGRTEGCGVIVKLVPETRVFGFESFWTPHTEGYNVVSIRRGMLNTISYRTMNEMIRNGIVNERLFRRYAAGASKTGTATLSAMLTISESMRIKALEAAVSLLKETNAYGYFQKILDLTAKDISELEELRYFYSGIGTKYLWNGTENAGGGGGRADEAASN